MVTLNGSGSTDPDYGIASYEWTQTAGSSVTLSDPNIVNPEFSTPEIDSGSDDDQITLTFQLTVTDTKGAEDTDTCVITVEEEDAWCFISAASKSRIRVLLNIIF